MDRKEYSTVGQMLNGMDYRTMSRLMTKAGWKMNHATARNILLKSMRKFARIYSNSVNGPTDRATLNRIIADPNFQSGLGALIQDAYAIRQNKK